MTLSSPDPALLLDVRGEIAPEPRVHYLRHPFTVPEGVGRLHLTFDFHKERVAQLFIALFDPHAFRGCRMNPGGRGDIRLELWITPDDAGEGAIPGAIPAGEWTAQIDIEALEEVSPYHLTVQAATAPEPSTPFVLETSSPIVKAEAGWYRGELHAHSTESDGKQPVSTVIEAAIQAGLDFFALTDHFTVSQWRKLTPYAAQIALLHSCEITSHQGHANVHGLNKWVDVYVDRPDWSMNAAADAVHTQGGLFCINHPFSGRLGWQAYDFDWDRADLIEVYHQLEGINNTYQVGLWDRLLASGHRIVGVAGIDCHDPFSEFQRLGQLVTWVYADALSEAGIIAGLRRGRVYFSRGAQVRFTAEADGQTYHLWETAPLSPVRLHIDVLNDSPEARRVLLFVFKNGLFFHARWIDLADEWQTVTLDDTPSARTYYRVELHRPHSDSHAPYLLWRDHHTMEAMTNPIWVG
ncbi:MAG: CehA/McbA family metallohydrolase [bacterium]|nr:CehA/McbA family metallohydrolase [bacterium]